MHMHFLRALITLVFVGSVATHADAATIVVKKGTMLSSIQSGVDLAASGDLVRVMPGVYEESIVVPGFKSGIRIEAKGKVVVDVRSASGGPIGAGFTIYAPDARLRGFTVRHALMAGGMTTGNGIFGLGSGIEISRCTVLNSGEHGIRVDGSAATIDRCVVRKSLATAIVVNGNVPNITRCVVDGAALGITVFGTGPVITNNVVRLIRSEVGIGVSGSSARIHKNVVEDAHGALVFCSGDDARITQNKLANSLSNPGIEVGGTDVVVQGNVVRNTWGAGIHVAGNGAQVLDNDVRDSHVVDPGIILNVANQGVVSGNRVRDALSSGLVYVGNEATIRKNRIERCGTVSGFGPALVVIAPGSEISGNTVLDSRHDGINVGGNDVILTKNVVRRSILDGFDLLGHSMLITANSAIDNQGEGFELNALAGTFRKNVAKGNRIDVAVTAPLNVFEANTFTSGGPITVPEIN